MIPRIVHFCHGFADKAPVFPLVHYIAVRSAMHWIHPEAVHFHFVNEPVGPYWDAIRPSLTLVRHQPFDHVFDRPIRHFAHKADVVRLRALIESGGIYLDIDTICCRPWDGLLAKSCVLGLQRYHHGELGLCNAVMLGEPGNTFLADWLAAYRDFSDARWDEFSVRVPFQIAGMSGRLQPRRDDLHVEPVESFFQPDYTPSGLKNLFERVVSYPRAYCHHLWESFGYRRYLLPLTEDLVREVDTTYNLLARPFLPSGETA